MRHPTKPFLTTKHTKATKVSDIKILKLLNFVLFVTFVVKIVVAVLVLVTPRCVLPLDQVASVAGAALHGKGQAVALTKN